MESEPWILNESEFFIIWIGFFKNLNNQFIRFETNIWFLNLLVSRLDFKSPLNLRHATTEIIYKAEIKCANLDPIFGKVLFLNIKIYSFIYLFIFFK